MSGYDTKVFVSGGICPVLKTNYLSYKNFSGFTRIIRVKSVFVRHARHLSQLPG